MEGFADSTQSLRFLSDADLRGKQTLINVLEAERPKLKEADAQIVGALLDDFKAEKWSFLRQQEIDFLEANDQSKWTDYLLYRWKFRNFTSMKKVPEFPLYLLVEPTSVCNLRCSMCFQSDKTFSSNKSFMGRMDFELFKRVIDEAVAGGTKALTMASRGEPTTHPKFGEMLEYVKGKFHDIKINTNGLLLSDKLIRTILDANLSIVVFSVDAYDKEGYLEVRRSTQFDRLVKNIKRFHEIRTTEYPNSRTATRAHAVKVSKDFDEEKFKAFWGDIIDQVTSTSAVMRWDTYNNPKMESEKPCSTGIDRMYVWYDGTCNPCDVDYKSCLGMGNVKENSIATIWNGPKYQAFREAHFEGKRGTLFPCDRCEL